MTGTSRLPVQITETGLVPAIDGKTSVMLIERSIAYRYDDHGARIAIDGPLGNAAVAPGPANSGITEFDHDWATHLLKKVTAPGNPSVEIVSRDAAARPQVIRSSDGVAMQTFRFERNWSGQATRIRIDAERLASTPPGLERPREPNSQGDLQRMLHCRYDSLGKLIAITSPGGLITTFRYDEAGEC